MVEAPILYNAMLKNPVFCLCFVFKLIRIVLKCSFLPCRLKNFCQKNHGLSWDSSQCGPDGELGWGISGIQFSLFTVKRGTCGGQTWLQGKPNIFFNNLYLHYRFNFYQIVNISKNAWFFYYPLQSISHSTSHFSCKASKCSSAPYLTLKVFKNIDCALLKWFG